MSTRMQGRVSVGPTPSPDLAAATTAEGILVANQKVSIGYDGTLVQNATLNIPVGSDIIDIIVDVTTAYNSATSATFSAGTSSGDTTYASGVNAKTGGRTRPAFTAAQVAAMQNITNGTITFTVTSVGQPTAGAAIITVLYEPAAN